MSLLTQLGDIDVNVRLETQDHRNDPGLLDDLICVEVDGRQVRFAVEYRKRPPYPAEQASLTPLRKRLSSYGNPLLVVPFVSESTGRRLIEAGWSWADEAGNFDLRARGVRLRQRVTHSDRPAVRGILPGGSGSWAVIRRLISDGEVTSLTKLALDSGVSQPRISQVLNRLQSLGLIERPTRSKWTADRSALLDQFLHEYPGPGGSTSYLYTLDSLLESSIRLARRRPQPSMAVSADVASDLIAPWRRPTQAVIYTEAPLQLRQLIQATPAHDVADANIIHRVPDDSSIFAIQNRMDWEGTQVPLADPAQVLWDLRDLGGDDRLEAAERLRAWLLRP